MNKNPFSIYDFLGYLFPGLVAFMLFMHCMSNTFPINAEAYFHYKDNIGAYFGQKDENWWESTILIVLVSYILGHIIAYLSSSMVEYFANRIYDYPSHYLLHDDNLTYNDIKRRYWKNIKLGSNLWRLLVFVILIPVSLTMSMITPLIRFVVRPLDEYVRNGIIKKLCKLSEKLGIEDTDVNSEADYHRIVMHYAYLNIENVQRKADNYVAIYGFLRAMTLITCVFFDYVFISEIFYTSKVLLQYGCDKCFFDTKAITILVTIFILCNVLYMAFIKFYRRFTLENYMAVLTEK